jgi:hypothetical protein
MTVSKIKAWHIVDPEAARQRVMGVFEECEGCSEETAEQLGIHYQTFLRLIKSDPKLSEAILEARLTFIAKGITQRGWGDWHEAATDRV